MTELEDTCRFCNQKFNRQQGGYYYGNFVCNNCVDIMALALYMRKHKIVPNKDSELKK